MSEGISDTRNLAIPTLRCAENWTRQCKLPSPWRLYRTTFLLGASPWESPGRAVVQNFVHGVWTKSKQRCFHLESTGDLINKRIYLIISVALASFLILKTLLNHLLGRVLTIRSSVAGVKLSMSHHLYRPRYKHVSTFLLGKHQTFTCFAQSRSSITSSIYRIPLENPVAAYV